MNSNFQNCFLCCLKSNVWTLFDLLLLLLSFGSFLVDIATDVIVVYQYYKNGHTFWMLLTVSFVCVPSLMVQTFSYRWFVADERVSKLICFVHIFQLGLFYRFIELLQLGFKMRKKQSKMDFQNFNQQQSDMCMLRLFESFTESAPQLVLQLYIMVTTDDWNPWTGISAAASIMSLSWGISAYSKAMRNVRPEKQKLSWWGLLFQALWRIGMVSSRIISLVLFAVSFGYWIITVLSLHWFVMTIWIFLQNTDFCSSWWEERLYNCVIGVVYCFCFFNLKEGRSSYRMLFFYSFTITQNIIFLLAFYKTNTNNHYFTNFIIIFVPCGMFLGLLSMLLYYRFFHPSGPITLFSHNVLKVEDEESNKKNVMFNNCTLKTSRKLDYDGEAVQAASYISAVSVMTIEDNWKTYSTLAIPDEYYSLSKTSNFHRYHSFSCSWDSYFYVCKICYDLHRKTLAYQYKNSIHNYMSNPEFTRISNPESQKQSFSNVNQCDEFVDMYCSNFTCIRKCASLPNLDVKKRNLDILLSDI